MSDRLLPGKDELKECALDEIIGELEAGGDVAKGTFLGVLRVLVVPNRRRPRSAVSPPPPAGRRPLLDASALEPGRPQYRHRSSSLVPFP